VKKDTKMNISIRLHNDRNTPYYYSGDSKTCRHVENEEWITDDRDMAVKIVRDMLDVPESELTLEQVKEDFSDRTCNASEEQIVAIRNYYNGRFAMYNRILDEIENCCENKTSRYDIPYEYNHFVVDADEPARETQNEAYVELKFSL